MPSTILLRRPVHVCVLIMYLYRYGVEGHKLLSVHMRATNT